VVGSSAKSGTGLIISQDGLILTNAHVAQFLLLKDLYQKDFINCVIRTGSPAYPRYKTELVYISPSWIEKNKTEITKENPQGTGENDYAFLRITESIDGSKLPTFSFLPINLREKIDLGESVVLVSYPAGFLGGLSILQGLSVASSVTNVQDLFTFQGGTIDVIDVGGTVVSQKGASGGAVVDKQTTLIGIISTSTSGATTSSRELNAITLSYINRVFKNESGITIPELISSNLADFAKKFQENTAVGLTDALKDQIIKR
jgi:S1-C subfamily serine protease